VHDPEEAVQTALATGPDLVAVADCPGFPWADVCNTIRLSCPACWTVLLATQDVVDENAANTAMMVGVRQLVHVPHRLSALGDVIGELRALETTRETDEYVKTTDPHRFPRVIAVSGAKGGVGKTTIATNLAVALNSKNAGKVVLWDAYSQFGDVANIMGLKPSRVLAELSDTKSEDTDESLILNYIMRHDSGTDVLLTSNQPLPLNLLSAELTESVIGALRKHYRFIVADTPPILDAVSSTIFTNCWRLLVVTTLKDVTSVSDTMKLIELLEPDYVKGEAIALVANRVAKGDAVKDREMELLTAKAMAMRVPEDPEIGQANNLGKPICQGSPRSPSAKAIHALCDEILKSASTFSINALCRLE
jgi:pilus assembly protein CpaE